MIPEDRRREAARVKDRGNSLPQQMAVLAFAVSALLVLLLF